jgi:hypothetical protein
MVRWKGHEHCGYCLQSYVYALEVFCTRCDRPICPLCVVRRGFQVARVCPECAREKAEEEA